MFNTYQQHDHHHEVAPAYPQEVNHHNAPTLEVAKYLDELRKQAHDDALKAMLINSEVGQFRVGKFRRNDLAADWYEVTFQVNGKVIKTDVTICDNERDGMLGSVEAIIYKAVVEHIVGDAMHERIIR